MLEVLLTKLEFKCASDWFSHVGNALPSSRYQINVATTTYSHRMYKSNQHTVKSSDTCAFKISDLANGHEPQANPASSVIAWSPICIHVLSLPATAQKPCCLNTCCVCTSLEGLARRLEVH